MSKRHVVTISFYSWGDAREVYNNARNVCKELIKQDDNQASIVSIYFNEEKINTSKIQTS